MSSKNSNSTIRLTSPPIISDEDASQNDYKILLRRKTRKGFQKVSAPCCIHPQPSFDSTNLEFNKPILDTFSPMFYYSLRKGTYKAKVIRHVNSDGKKIFISSNWIHFTIYKDQTL